MTEKIPALEQHLKRLMDMTVQGLGLVQHCDLDKPAFEHDLSGDDQARAIIAVSEYSERIQVPDLISTWFDFLIQSQRTDGYCNNFKNQAGIWLTERNGIKQEPKALQDCTARNIWAASELYFSTYPKKLRKKAKELFFNLLDTADKFDSIHSQALAIIGLSKYLENKSNRKVRKITENLSEKLIKNLSKRKLDWFWFSDKMTWGNARLPHALLISGKVLGNRVSKIFGQYALDFLAKQSIDEQGIFHAIKNQTWYTKKMKEKGEKSHGCEQPLEAAAFAQTCALAYNIFKDEKYLKWANAGMDWFTGKNSINKSLLLSNGAVCDAITYKGELNINHGAEPILSYLIAKADYDRLGQ